MMMRVALHIPETCLFVVMVCCASHVLAIKGSFQQQCSCSTLQAFCACCFRRQKACFQLVLMMQLNSRLLVLSVYITS